MTYIRDNTQYHGFGPLLTRGEPFLLLRGPRQAESRFRAREERPARIRDVPITVCPKRVGRFFLEGSWRDVDLVAVIPLRQD